MTVNRRTDLLLLAVAVVWGSSYLAAAHLLTPDTVFPVLALRFGVAAAAMVVLVGARMRSLRREELLVGLVCGGLLSVVLALETLGLARTSPSNAGLIISLAIVFTPLLGRQRLPVTFYGGLLITLVGVAVLTTGGLHAPGLGDGLVLLAAVVRALHLTVMDRLGSPALDAGRTTAVQLLVAAAVFLLAASVSGPGVGQVGASFGPGDWAVTLYLGLGATVFAFAAQMWAVRHTSSSRVSLLLGTEPLWAAAFGMAFGGAPVTAGAVAGAVLILAGVNWARSVEARHRALYTRPDGRPDDNRVAAVALPGEVHGR